MPISAQIAVSSTPALLTADLGYRGAKPSNVIVRNAGTGDVWIGSKDVAPSTGFLLADGDQVALDLQAADGGLFAVSTAGATVHVLRAGSRT